MALPACFHLADEVFPRVRAQAARQLLADGLSQSEVAATIGVSQAMISKYATRPDDHDPLVLRLADDLIRGDQDASWCDVLQATNRPGHTEALQDLLGAEQRLLRDGGPHLAPQVGINIARALPDATDPQHILAYPARILAAGDRLVRPVAPELGASQHLSACLLALRRHDPSLHAILNVHSSALDAVDATMSPDGDRVTAFTAAIEAAPHARIIRDPGAIGIEPCIYIAAPTATAAINTLLETT